MRIKRLIQKVMISIRKNFSKYEYEMRSVYEKDVISICRKIARRDDSQLLLCPKSGKRYVNNPKLQIYVIIQSDNIDIINHTYHYNVPVSIKSLRTITNIFDGHVELRRSEMEKDIMANVKNSLQTINNKIKNC